MEFSSIFEESQYTYIHHTYIWVGTYLSPKLRSQRSLVSIVFLKPFQIILSNQRNKAVEMAVAVFSGEGLSE